MREDLIIKKVREVLEKKGGRLISVRANKAGQIKVTAECEKGHRWRDTGKNIINGSWCRFCEQEKYKQTTYQLKILKECQKFAQQKGGKFLSDIYLASDDLHLWECEAGHKWWATFNYAKKNWCLKCKKEVDKKIEEIAKQNKGICLSEDISTLGALYLWKCEKGHVFKSSYTKIKSRLKKNKNWCPVCQGDKKIHRTFDDVKLLAESYNGKLLSKSIKNINELCLWECEAGHRWYATVHNVLNGHWCPECAMEKKFNKNFSYIKRIAEKYNGKLLSNELKGFKEPYLWECENGHRFEASFRFADKYWCPECRKIKSKTTLHDLQEFARSKKGKCLSKKYIGCAEYYLWECESGHRWYATFNYAKKNWCSKCKK